MQEERKLTEIKTKPVKVHCKVGQRFRVGNHWITFLRSSAYSISPGEGTEQGTFAVEAIIQIDRAVQTTDNQ